jgi:pilus assembly protein Flp/PilA
MLNQVIKFVKDEQGQGMTEYGLILGVIAIGAIGAFMAFGDALIEKVKGIQSTIFGGTTTPTE